MNTDIHSELDLLRPHAVSNEMQHVRLGGAGLSRDPACEAIKVMTCRTFALAIGLTPKAARGGAKRCRKLSASLERPVFNASSENRVVANAMEEAGFTGVATNGFDAPSLPEVCETPFEDIETAFLEVADSDVDAILQVTAILTVGGLVAWH